jgi:CIC family chloride channel protein
VSFHHGVAGDRSEHGYSLPGGSFDAPPPDDQRLSGLLSLAVLAALAGAATGLVGGLFRRLLVEADVLRDRLLEWAREEPVWRWVVPVLVAAVLVALARLVVRAVPEAGGSGVQRVEAHIRGEDVEPPPAVLPAKFVGGLLALGSGMALGREGPTVQMGATIGGWAARRAQLSEHDTRTLAVSMAGAGLGVAFSAPLGGAMFVFEEVAHAFRTRLVVATLIATTTGLTVARLLVGPEPVLPVTGLSPETPTRLLLYAALGVVLGAMGVAYNRLVVRLLDLVAAIRRIPPEATAALVGAVVMAVGVAAPWLIGGSDALNESLLLSTPALGTLVLILLVRWVLGPLSYSVGTPGGLFAPLLVVGAAAGSLVAAAANSLVPALALSTTAFAVVGMSTFFTAVVRAPVTGIVLIMEMTAQTTLVIAMVIAAATAVVTATLLGGAPIYDTLRDRLPHGKALGS